MKKIIYKTNQYLLEKYPTLWNTKIVWVVLTTILLHVIFFTLGFFALTNPEILHEYDAKSIFFKNGTVYISIILSILIIVVWLIYLFKNNAFKSFYPTTRFNLFKQFLCYLIIVFLAITFFLSYNVGIKQYITNTYDDDLIEKEINVSNKAAIFFSQNVEDYTINRRRYPAPFNELFCETYEGSKELLEIKEFVLDTINPHLSFLDYKYHFYTLYSKDGTPKQAYNDTLYAGFVFFRTKEDTLRTYYYKDAIVDVSSFVKNAKPSYFNYSSRFYQSKKKKTANNLYEYNNYDDYNYQYVFSKENELWNKEAHNLLKRNNPDEIKQILADFLKICNQYEVKSNLNLNTWFNLIYHPESFELKSLIRNEPKPKYEYAAPPTDTASEVFNKNYLTNYYIESDALNNVFTNIEDIKSSTPYIESIHFFLWLAFFFAAVIFMFRVTGLKPLLFTIISAGIITLLVVLATVLFEYLSNYNNNTTGYFIAYLTLFISTIILAIPLFFPKKLKKGIIAICLNMSILGFVLYLFLIITIISLHQSDACIDNYSFDLNNKNCFNLLGSIGLIWSYILFIVNLIFICFYSGIIKNWKALPEG